MLPFCLWEETSGTPPPLGRIYATKCLFQLFNGHLVLLLVFHYACRQGFAHRGIYLALAYKQPVPGKVFAQAVMAPSLGRVYQNRVGTVL